MQLSGSKALNSLLADMGISTQLDILRHVPRRYEDMSLSLPRISFEDKERVVLLGKLNGDLPKTLRFSGKSVLRFYFQSHNFVYQVVAWNQPYLSKMLNKEDWFTLIGYYDKAKSQINLNKLYKGDVTKNDSLRPLYSLPSSLPNHVYWGLAKRCLISLEDKLPNLIPSEFTKKYRLCSRYDAYRFLHNPQNKEEIHQGLRHLKYEEALIFSMRNQLVKGANRELYKDKRRKIDEGKLNSFIDSLPYRLTESQLKAIKECLSDMNSTEVMYRLLQGDVGSGKTLVAAILAYANHLRSEQSAFMAPTDALARQHYENLKQLFEGRMVNVSLLVGSMPQSERNAVLRDLADGSTDIVVGTHSLFSKNVHYAYLGLAIIDEQHKFGVNQRTLLVDKGEHADLLMMSATPIPRTLTMSVYGDMDISTLEGFPSGKRDTKTEVISSKDKRIDREIEKSLAKHHRIFVVVPRIDGEDDSLTSVLAVSEAYKKKYPGKVSLMHGRMDEESLEAGILAFKTGLTPILVATSLIEVGIDVKEADLMIIYSASRFSLSSLHQLRGRVGRDGSPSLCLLLDDGKDETSAKLDILTKTEDGFRIAEEDLRLRGPGELTGVKQSGLPQFNTLNIIDDYRIFECARKDASEILANQLNPENKAFVEMVQKDGPDSRLL